MTDATGPGVHPFTHHEYLEVVRLARRSYQFVGYAALAAAENASERMVFWRHDIDISPHRAVRLAEIESAESVQTTYFVDLHSPHYHFWERAVRDKLREIAGFGHWFGLHFDLAYYGATAQEDISAYVRREADILCEVVERPMEAISFHNPPDDVWANQRAVIAGLVNAYGPAFHGKIDYVSDSNGVWRFRDLRTVLTDDRPRLLQVLTHPEWWTDRPTDTTERVLSCIEGRAQSAKAFYFENVRRADGN